MASCLMRTINLQMELASDSGDKRDHNNITVPKHRFYAGA